MSLFFFVFFFFFLLFFCFDFFFLSNHFLRFSFSIVALETFFSLIVIKVHFVSIFKPFQFSYIFGALTKINKKTKTLLKEKQIQKK